MDLRDAGKSEIHYCGPSSKKKELICSKYLSLIFTAWCILNDMLEILVITIGIAPFIIAVSI